MNDIQDNTKLSTYYMAHKSPASFPAEICSTAEALVTTAELVQAAGVGITATDLLTDTGCECFVGLYHL